MKPPSATSAVPLRISRFPASTAAIWTRDDCKGERGLLVMFICNHCPYVQAVRDRIVRDARELAALGIGCVAIMSNDASDYPEDSFENMKRVADELDFPFPYLYDESQAVARAYGAVCTPDFFGYDAELGLQYRGRLDASRKEAAPADVRRDLFEAMKTGRRDRRRTRRADSRASVAPSSGGRD